MNNEIKGILLVDKPAGITSHDVINIFRKKLDTRRIGHAGTLDPLATGLLIVLVGKATKESQYFSSLSKCYEVGMTLGVKTKTADREGELVEKKAVPGFTHEDIHDALINFRGASRQVPPMYSAKKVKGKKLYQLARKGIEIKRDPHDITIFDIKIERIVLPEVFFSVVCSKGTYVRTLCEDIGERLGCGAHMSALRRAGIGEYNVADAVDLNTVSEMDSVELIKRFIPV
ncbi:MAG: tRNA pseudouridine(55) synthase TruB [Candidatus Omnitrophica bacterium]|nr:tRNA pseudouridine(55) synthase TruB [Candidatus Omnitrophota bacterium]